MPRNRRPGLTRASLFAVFPLLCSCIDSSGLAPSSRPLDAHELAPGAAISAARAEAGWPAGQWWRAYGDPQLDRWMDRALAGSPSLAMAAARVRQARARAGVVEADEAPQLGLDASLQRKRWSDDAFYGPGDLARSSSWNNTSQLGFSYPLDIWGRERSRGESALDQARATASEARLAALELQGNLVRSYIGLALHHAELDIAEAELARQEQLLALVRQRRHDGIGTGQEEARAQLGLPEAHRQIDLLHEAIALDRNQLAALAGAGPGRARRCNARPCRRCWTWACRRACPWSCSATGRTWWPRAGAWRPRHGASRRRRRTSTPTSICSAASAARRCRAGYWTSCAMTS